MSERGGVPPPSLVRIYADIKTQILQKISAVNYSTDRLPAGDERRSDPGDRQRATVGGWSAGGDDGNFGRLPFRVVYPHTQ